MGDFAVRRLRGDEAGRYNEMFALGTEAHPDTLRITRQDIVAAPFSTEASADAVSLVAMTTEGSWLGVVAVERERGRQKRRHIAWIVRMYVVASEAKRGVGRALLRAAVVEARAMAGVAKLNLTVAAHNAGAIRLYESEGFVTFAHEIDAFRDGESRAELSMTRVL
jgi:GNAT superfamily N-acetyltransferase